MNKGLLTEQALWHGKLFSGTWDRAEAGVYDAVDKRSGELLARVGRASAQDVGVAASTAISIQPSWVATPPDERAAIFRRAATLLEQHREEVLSWNMRETGSIQAKAEMELRSAVAVLHASAAMMCEPQGLVMPGRNDRLSYARRVPHGVVGVIAPFNFPLTLSIRAVAPGLITGNAVILKPDPQTAVFGGILLARLFQEAGLPVGVLHVLPGGAEVGEAMCSDRNVGMIAFTGSTAAGRKVGALCGANLKKVSLELGGKNSLIVLDDADIEMAASCAAFGSWFHQGQICMATGRILVHESIVDPLIRRLADKAERAAIGDTAPPGALQGPLINKQQLEGVAAIVRDSVAAGARLIAGGAVQGRAFQPTVLGNVLPGMRAFDEEIFGPVASVTPFLNDDEAVELANRTDYGLSAAVISRSAARGLAIGNRLRTGLLHINDQTIVSDPHIPYGGRGTSGNGSRVGGPANWDEFTQWQWVTVRDQPPAYPF